MIDDFDMGYYAGEKQAAEDLQKGVGFEGFNPPSLLTSSFTIGWLEGYEDARILADREDYERELKQRETE